MYFRHLLNRDSFSHNLGRRGCYLPNKLVYNGVYIVACLLSANSISATNLCNTYFSSKLHGAGGRTRTDNLLIMVVITRFELISPIIGIFLRRDNPSQLRCQLRHTSIKVLFLRVVTTITFYINHTTETYYFNLKP